MSEKQRRKFIQFDIDSFYPSISEKLINDAITWASQFVHISEEDKLIIFHTCKSLLYHNGAPWVKKNGSNCDVGMGSYDGAEKCDLVGLFILSLLRDLPMEVGLFRDDDLGVSTAGQTARQVESTKKKICAIFKNIGLSITIKANLDTVEFLDAEVCLSTGIHRVFTKPNNTLRYVDVNSNHPKSVIKSIPFGVQKRLSALSSNEEVFNQTAPQYQEALERSGHQHKLKYENQSTTFKNNRKRNITWFTPPFSSNVKTNIGAKALKAIDICFPPEHRLHTVINRNTFKVSYSTMPNFGQVISRHNIKVSNQDRPLTPEQRDQTGCNCRVMICPMRGECKPGNMVYKATVTRDDTGKAATYTGLASNSFKERWRGHDSSFNNSHLRKKNELSKYVWKLKDSDISHSICWQKLGQAQAFNSTNRVCRLCLLEKYFIMFKQDGATMNKNTEFYTTCMHKKKLLIQNG